MKHHTRTRDGRKPVEMLAVDGRPAEEEEVTTHSITGKRLTEELTGAPFTPFFRQPDYRKIVGGQGR